MSTHKAMGAHQSARPITTTWLTPPPIIAGLGGADSFDLDPCGLKDSPIRTALHTYAECDIDGLSAPWWGRVWLNPPYTTGEVGGWLSKLADHGHGTALIFARTETETFVRQVWERAHGLLFLHGRLHFHYPDGTRAKANAGAPSVLCAYGEGDLDRLAGSDLDGTLVPLRFRRGVAVLAFSALADGADDTWKTAVAAALRKVGGEARVSDLYRALAQHPKTKANPHWQAKVRQTLQRGPFTPKGGGAWSLAA